MIRHLHRLEHVAVLLITVGLGLAHVREIDFWKFVPAFALIDLVGYLPGAIAQRKAGARKIAPLFHHLYNVTHSYLVHFAIVGLWALAAGRFEWAMLAAPIHLSIDRGLFGNSYKPVALPFEVLA